MSTNIRLSNCFAAISQRKNAGILATALVAVGALGGWGCRRRSSRAPRRSIPCGRKSRLPSLPIGQTKAALVGSYTVTGTDPDGVPYNGTKIVAISLAPSGALEFDWNDGTFVGVGQLVDNVLAVAYAIKGRTVIALRPSIPTVRSPETGSVARIEGRRRPRIGRKRRRYSTRLEQHTPFLEGTLQSTASGGLPQAGDYVETFGAAYRQ